MKRQRIQKQKILFKGIETEEQYRDLVFVTKNNRPTQQFIVQEAIGAIVNRIRKEHPDYEMFSPHCLRHTFATRAIETICKPYLESETLSVTGWRPIISKLPKPLEMQAFHGFVNFEMARLVA